MLDLYEDMDKINASIEALAVTLGKVPNEKTAQLNIISQKMCYFTEDLNQTLASFTLKDSVKDKKIEKTTVKYADQYYRTRLYEISILLIPLLYELGLKVQVELLSKMNTKLISNCRYSLSMQGDGVFRNPYPSHLFFSQRFHANHFSTKSQRPGVMGEQLSEITAKLTRQEISPDALRVNMYFAPFRGSLQPFAYNNRTWVVFSKAGVQATRIVPMMPSQDLLNRITQNFPTKTTDPNLIIEEGTEETRHPTQTVSLRANY